MNKCYVETEQTVSQFLAARKDQDSSSQMVGIPTSRNEKYSGIIVTRIRDTAYVFNYAQHADMLPTPPFLWDSGKKWNTVTAKTIHHLGYGNFIHDIATEHIQSPFQNIHKHHIHEIVDWAISIMLPNPSPPNSNVWFSNSFIPTLVQLERNRLHYDGQLVPVEYNPYTATTRASSKAYLSNGETLFIPSMAREKKVLITPRSESGMLINLDFDAFHLRLIANYLQIPIPHTSAHMHYAGKYFQTSSPTPEQYRLSKEKTFHTIYSDKEPEIDDALFDAVIEFKKSITPTSELRTYESRTVPEDEWTTKRFNYWIQMMEVEMSTKLIQHMIKEAYNPKICLFVYDSILIDSNYTNIEDIMNAIILWNERNPCFPLTVSAGKDYANLTKIN